MSILLILFPKSFTMYGALLPIHSLLRWALLLLLLAAIIKSLSGLLSKSTYGPSDNKTSLFLMISAHLQLVVGLLMFFVSPMVQFTGEAMKSAELRFFTMEHSTMMIIAIALITMGRILSKKAQSDRTKHLRSFIFFTLALLIIFMMIPWPFHLPGNPAQRPWFYPFLNNEY
jgi:hypothetical protein